MQCYPIIGHCMACFDRQWTMSCKTACTTSTQKKEEFLLSTWIIIQMYLSWKIIIIFNKIIIVKRLIFLITSTKYKHNDFFILNPLTNDRVIKNGHIKYSTCVF